MIIGIDFHSAEREGSGNCTYIRNLVEAMVSLGKRNEYILYVTHGGYSYYDRFKKLNNVRIRKIPFTSPMLRIPLLGLMTYQDKLDILHCQYVAPPVHQGRLILSVHDVAFMRYPECFRFIERCRQRALLPVQIKKARKVLTISEHSKNDIKYYYGVPGNGIEVIPLAANGSFRPSASPASKDILARYRISGKYIFYIGRLDARKNIYGLLEAYERLKRDHGIAHKLVIGGKEDYFPENVKDKYRRSPYKKDIIVTGYVGEDDLPSLYSHAEVFVYPSLYEGFGLPCLEAMACGCPVITSDVSSLPEVVGKAGRLVDPLDVVAMAGEINTVISNPAIREQAIRSGLERASIYSWKSTAENTLRVYGEVLE